MAKFRAEKTELHGVFRLVHLRDGSLARVLKAAFSDYEAAEDWAAEYAEANLGCDMAVDTVDVKIRAWDGTTSSMTLLK